jgi:hypothetical protein
MGAVIMVLAVVRATMKNMKYFIRPEHFDAIGKLMLIISMTWAYFFFNDYMVQWYGGDKWTKTCCTGMKPVRLGWMWFLMLIVNVAIPWLVLWNKKWRSNPWVVFVVGLLINVGMYIERYIIVPISLTINRSLSPGGVPAGHRNPVEHRYLAFFILLYMLAAKFIPLGSGLGSAGGTDGAFGQEIWTRDRRNGQRIGIGAGRWLTLYPC